MTVPATARRAGPFTGTGVSAAFPFEFKVFAASDLRVTVATTVGAESTLDPADYSVTINPDQETSPGGEVTYTLPTGYVLAILGDTDYTQELDLGGGGNFNPVVIENALDRMVFQIQQLVERNDRVLSLGETVADDVSAQLPAPAPLALIGWNEGGTRLQNLDATTLASVVAYGNTVVVQATATGAPGETFTLPSNPGSLNNIQMFVGGLGQRPTTDFTWDSDVTLTVVGSLPAGAAVLIRFNNALPVGTVGDGSVTESKLDAPTAAKLNGALQKSGGTMTGALTLAGNASADLGAVPKQQAESIATSAAASAVANRMQYSLTASQATTSGSAVDFVGIPSWAKRITVMLNGVSINGSDGVSLLLRTAAGPVSSGYETISAYVPNGTPATATSGAQLLSCGAVAATEVSGVWTLNNFGGNTWVAHGGVYRKNDAGFQSSAGRITLADVVTGVRLQTGAAFDAGSVSLLIEG